MSYDKNVGNQEVKFEDEKSYLNCKLDYINYCEDHSVAAGFEPTFLQFIQDEMYFTDTCTVESVGSIQHAGTPGSLVSVDLNGNYAYLSSDTSSNPIGFASGGGNQSETVSVSSYGTYTTGIDYGVVTGDVHISGNLVVDGDITWSNGYSGLAGSNEITFTTHEAPKEEPPEDPIDSRFDIIDL
jgi:hypothetical protein